MTPENYFLVLISPGAFTTGEAGTLGPGAGAILGKTAQRAGGGFSRLGVILEEAPMHE